MPNDNDQRLSRDCKRSTTMRAQCDTCGTVPPQAPTTIPSGKVQRR